KNLFHWPSKAIQSKTIEELMPGIGNGMQKLKGENLPDLPMFYSIDRQGQMVEGIKLAIKPQAALDHEGADERPNKNCRHTRCVKRISHVLAISNGHRARNSSDFDDDFQLDSARSVKNWVHLGGAIGQGARRSRRFNVQRSVAPADWAFWWLTQ